MNITRLLPLTIALAVTAVSAGAQSLKPPPRKAGVHPHPGLPEALSAEAAHKGTALVKRLVASSVYYPGSTGTAAISDSSRMYYSGSRGSRLDYNQMNYQPAIGYDHSRSALTSWDSAHATGTVMCDSATLWTWDTTSMALVQARGVRNVWNPDGTFASHAATDFDRSGAAAFGQRYVYTWSGGRVTGHTGFRWTGTGYDTFQRRSITYASGKAVADSYSVKNIAGAWEPSYRSRNTYNTAGQVIVRYEEEYTGSASGWVPYGSDTLEWYPSGQLKTVEYSYPDAPGLPLRTYYLDSFGYAAGVPGFMHYTSFDIDSEGARSVYQTVQFGLNGSGQKDTQTVSLNVGVVVPFIGAKFRYDAEGLLVRNTAYGLIGPAPALFGDVFYYYETFDDAATGLAPEPGASGTVYPNPVNDVLHFSWSGAKPGAPVSLRLVNASGQTVHSESFPWRGRAEAVSIAHLPPGVYWLSATSGDERLCRRQLIRL